MSVAADSNTRNYPLNCWYVAATSDELGPELIARRLLDQAVLMYRESTGAVVALADRCPHRGVPLSRGRLVDDHVECGYHGFTFAGDGECVRVPSQEHVPPGSRVHAYPLREEPPFVWIWPGDPAKSALVSPPRLPWLTQHDTWSDVGGIRHIEANHLLLHDNALDLTHLPYVHDDASPRGYLTVPPPLEISVTETSIGYSRTFAPSPLVEWQAVATGLPREKEFALREWGTFVSPALVISHMDILSPEDDGTPGAYQNVFIRGLTPEGPTSTTVFWRVARNYALNDGSVGEHLAAKQQRWMDEDKVLVELIQAQPPLPQRRMEVNADIASIRVRQIVETMVAEERGRTPVRPGFAVHHAGVANNVGGERWPG